MLNSVHNPLAPESRLDAGGLFHNSFHNGILKPSAGIRVVCSSLCFPAAPLPSDLKRFSSAAEQIQRIGSKDRLTSRTTTRVASIANPFFPDYPQDAYVKKSQNGAATSRSPRVEVSAKGKWQNKHDSSLSEDEPLPLPMTWPNSEPASNENIEAMLKCDPEQENCKDVIYQWTGDCSKCQGTGLVSYYRKRHHVVSKCVTCLGIGSVHKITSRADIQGMEGLNGSSNGSARGSSGTNGRS